jgi:hypothetical protein
MTVDPSIQASVRRTTGPDRFKGAASVAHLHLRRLAHLAIRCANDVPDRSGDDDHVNNI